MKILRLIALAALLMTFTTTRAADESPVPPPPLPDELEGYGNIPQPEVTIIHEEDRVIEEVRISGELRYIKVTPKSGPPYYFIDTDGDGQLETRRNELDNPTINQWILKRW